MYTRSFAKWGSYQESSLQGMRSDNPSRPSQSVTTFDANGNVVGITEDVWGNPDAASPSGQLQRSFINGKGADPNKALGEKPGALDAVWPPPVA